MRYESSPSAFKVAHWRRLYNSYICDAASVRKIIDAGHAIFVIFDAEPWGGDNSKPAELGITLMAASSICEMDPVNTMPITLDEAMHQYKLESHCISIAEHERTSTTSIERHRFGCEFSIAADKVESHIVHLVLLFRDRHYARPEDVSLILAGFDIVFELGLLSRLYGKLATFFSSWLDIQELAILMSDTRRPGLNRALQACGFGKGNVKDLHSNQGQHNAATDTVRAAAVLLHLMRLHESDEMLTIPTTTRRAHVNQPIEFPHDRRIWEGERPKPRELYPYTARVKRTTGKPHTAQELLHVFAEYAPVAAGSAKNRRPYGWVCLPSLEALDDFVRKVDGAANGDGGAWSVVSDYDDSTVPALSMEEIQQRIHEGADAKREARKLKRLADECRDGDGLL